MTDANLTLLTYYRTTGSMAAVVGYGDLVYNPEKLVENPSDATNNRIRVGSKEGKIAWIGANGYALRADGTPTYCIGISDFLIPDSDGMVDLSLLTLPYAQNYGLGITDLDIKMMWTSCDGDHRFGWKDWNGSHIWGCTRCPGRDPLKKGPVPDGENVPGEWENNEKRCTICGHRVVKDTTPPVIEGIRNGWRYGLYDTSDGQLGTRSFTVRDPEQDKEVSSGIKSVTVNGVEQTGPDYVLTAPETNGENGLSCEIVATDNAGNSSSMRVELYRYHLVQFFHTRDDPSSRIIELGVLHNGTCKWFYHLPKEAYFIDLDNEDIKIYHEEGDYYNFGVINRNRRFLQVIPKTELPTLELGLRSRRFWGYHADSEGEFIYADMPSRTEKGYRMDIRLTSDEDSYYYYGSPESYTLEQLKALDAEGKIKWKKYNTESFLTFDLAPYDEYNGSWYYYAKATNELGTRYVSSSRIIIDADPPVAREYPSGQELAGKIISSNEGTKPTTYWGDLRFTVVDDSEVTVKEKDTILEPDENGVYTLKADFEKYIDRKIIIRDAGGNSATYMNDIRMNTLDRRDNPAPLNLPNGADLGERLPKTVWIMTARDGYLSRIPVIWKIPETYNRALKREQSFTVNGTLNLSGTDIVLHPDRTELGNAQIAVNIAGAPRYKVTIADTTVYAHWSYTGDDGSQGAGGSAFDSGGNATRGEAAAAIWRIEGSPAPKGRSIFIDVDAKHQYAAPITWAAENGMCMGYGDGRFGPNDPLTREQLAFTFYRYARYKGYDTTAKGNTDTFGDADKIMPYAKPAMQWAAGSGLIQAKLGNRLDPQGTVSRAELTAMRDRFIKKYGLVQGIAPGGLTGWIDPKRLLIPQTGDSGAWGIYGFALCASLAAGVALITFRLRRRREKAPLQGTEK